VATKRVGLDPNQKLVLLPRPTPAPLARDEAAPDDRDVGWWLEDVTTKGKRRPARPPSPDKIVHVETQEQFDQLQPAIDAYERNEDFDAPENTRQQYEYEWRSFFAWCRARGQKALPAKPNVVALYMADITENERDRRVRCGPRGWLSDEPRPVRVLGKLPPRRPKGVGVALAAIRKRHLEYGYPSPTDDQEVRNQLDKIERRFGLAIDRKLPLTTEHLEQMMDVLEHERSKPTGRTSDERKAMARRSIRNRAILLVGWAGAFRRSELAALVVGDIAYTPDGMDANVQWSKTDQKGQGFVKAIPLGERMCPKEALQEWLSAGHIDDGVVFREITRYNKLVPPATERDRPTTKVRKKAVEVRPMMNRGNGLTGHAIGRIVKHYVQAIGLNPESYSGHSLRRGFITIAAEQGKSVQDIMSLTGHKDMRTLWMYIQFVNRFKNAPGKGLL